MINILTGTIRSIEGTTLTLEVSGCGFAVSVAHPEQYTVNQALSLLTHMHWNPESGPTLFGFATSAEKTFFIMVTNCSGLGPKLALSLIQQASIGTYVAAVMCGDVQMLHGIKGLGPKKAETLIRELRSKIDQLQELQLESSEPFLRHLKDLTETLTALKYSSSEINQTLDIVRQQENRTTATFDQLLRSALTHLQKVHI